MLYCLASHGGKISWVEQSLLLSFFGCVMPAPPCFLDVKVRKVFYVTGGPSSVATAQPGRLTSANMVDIRMAVVFEGLKLIIMLDVGYHDKLLKWRFGR